MFTGLIEALGVVVSLEQQGEQSVLELEVPFAAELNDGDSVAINGCCLTVVSHDEERARFHLLTQTLDLTSLGQLVCGRRVNLERALAVGSRLGGHFVQGHVDVSGEVLALSPRGKDHRLEVALPAKVAPLCIPQGSLAVDGISLTIAELLPSSAVFWLIPHTMQATNLQEMRVGQFVNLEADLLAKYVQRLTSFGGVDGGRC